MQENKQKRILGHMTKRVQIVQPLMDLGILEIT